jgi:hypothetical protein
MSTMQGPRTQTDPAPDAADPFFYGWRDVWVKRDDGTEGFETVPLTPEDVLHPEEGDHIVQNDCHDQDRTYLRSVLAARVAGVPTALLLSDCGVAWDVPDLRPLAPDIAVFTGVRTRRNWGVLDVVAEGAQPILVLEITSPATRSKDLVGKVDIHRRAGVPHYLIADAREEEGRCRVRLFG